MTTEMKIVKEIILHGTMEERNAQEKTCDSIASLYNSLLKNDCKSLENIMTGEVITRDELLRVIGILDGLLSYQEWREVE